MSAGQWKRPYFLYKFHGQPTGHCWPPPAAPTFISIYPAKTKLQNTLFHHPTCFNLRVAGLHGPFSPRTPPLPDPSTFFYDVSCFSIIKRTDLSSWNFIHYFNLSSTKDFHESTRRLSLQKGKLCLVALPRFNVRFRHWKLLIELTKTTEEERGGRGGKKQKGKRGKKCQL